jgi:hypothetical protein
VIFILRSAIQAAQEAFHGSDLADSIALLSAADGTLVDWWIGRFPMPIWGHKLIGKSGDEDIIFVKAKRWAATVGVRSFNKFAERLCFEIGSKIVLIDGPRLAELMIEFEVAVATNATYTIRLVCRESGCLV